MRLRLVVPALLALLLLVPASAAAAPRARIVGMKLRHIGVGPVGPSYYVKVAVRLRVCGRGGRLRVRFTETSSPPNRNRPVLARKRRNATRKRRAHCQTHRFRWRLGDAFFGASRYRLAARAKTSRSRYSRVRARHIDTID